jgi:hypothetical protein
VKAWTFARGFDTFFQGVEQRASQLPTDEQTTILKRNAQARSMLEGPGSLAKFRDWKAPDELSK